MVANANEVYTHCIWVSCTWTRCTTFKYIIDSCLEKIKRF